MATPASSSAAPDAAVTPMPVAGQSTESETKKDELIPGLNTKPNESSFEQTPLESDTPTPEPEKTDKPDKPAPDVLSAPTKPTKKSKSGVILVAILVALALIGGAGYAYWQKRNETPATTSSKPDTNSTSNSQPNSATSISDKASNKIDQSLKKVDDSKDFQESDLSDTTLGL
jgi:uncharacterized protein HemX